MPTQVAFTSLLPPSRRRRQRYETSLSQLSRLLPLSDGELRSRSPEYATTLTKAAGVAGLASPTQLGGSPQVVDFIAIHRPRAARIRKPRPQLPTQAAELRDRCGARSHTARRRRRSGPISTLRRHDKLRLRPGAGNRDSNKGPGSRLQYQEDPGTQRLPMPI